MLMIEGDIGVTHCKDTWGRYNPQNIDGPLETKNGKEINSLLRALWKEPSL